MPHGITEQEYIARLAKRAQDPELRALVASWGPPTTEELALIARVFGGTVRKPVAATSEAAA